jgi:hypothetical protein
MVMPDTYFYDELPYEYLANSSFPMSLACWKIRPEQYGKLGQVDFSEEPVSGGQNELIVVKAEDKNPACRFEHSWGAMAFDRDVIDFAKDEMPHTGYLIPQLLEKSVPVGAKVMNGEYFDCGTPSEYLAMLKKTHP